MLSSLDKIMDEELLHNVCASSSESLRSWSTICHVVTQTFFSKDSMQRLLIFTKRDKINWYRRRSALESSTCVLLVGWWRRQGLQIVDIKRRSEVWHDQCNWAQSMCNWAQKKHQYWKICLIEMSWPSRNAVSVWSQSPDVYQVHRSTGVRRSRFTNGSRRRDRKDFRKQQTPMETGHLMCRTRDRTADRVRGTNQRELLLLSECAVQTRSLALFRVRVIEKTRLVVGTNKDIALLRVRRRPAQHNTWSNTGWRQTRISHGSRARDDQHCKDNTSNDPFSRCATCNNYCYSLRWRWQDKVGLQHQEENLELRMRGETERWDVRHQWRRENQDQHSAYERDTWQVLVHVVFLLVRVVVTHCTPHRVAQGSRLKSACLHSSSSMHEVCVTLRLWALPSIQLATLLILFQSPAAPVTLLLPRG